MAKQSASAAHTALTQRFSGQAQAQADTSRHAGRSQALPSAQDDVPFANVVTLTSGDGGPAPLALKACTITEYLVDFLNWSIMYSKFR